MAHDHAHVHDHDHGHTHDHDHDHDHEHEMLELDDEQYLAAFRAAKDEMMRDDPHSPLADGQRASFTGLSYYPYNPDLVLETPLDTEDVSGTVTMDTSTGDQTEYRRAGKIHFEVDGQPATLTIFADPDGELFLPMRDSTSGNETYGAGRYLEPEEDEDGHVLVDFNYLYNPYCAYNDRWSCPLPPMENWIKVPIRAGEKSFH